MASFAERLRELRIDKDAGQKEVGAIIGVSDSSIRKYESGERTPGPESIVKLADFFGVSTDYLLGRTDQKKSPVTIAASRSDDRMDDLPEQALKEIEQFKEFVRSKYVKRPN